MENSKIETAIKMLYEIKKGIQPNENNIGIREDISQVIGFLEGDNLNEVEEQQKAKDRTQHERHLVNTMALEVAGK